MKSFCTLSNVKLLRKDFSFLALRHTFEKDWWSEFCIILDSSDVYLLGKDSKNINKTTVEAIVLYCVRISEGIRTSVGENEELSS